MLLKQFHYTDHSHCDSQCYNHYIHYIDLHKSQALVQMFCYPGLLCMSAVGGCWIRGHNIVHDVPEYGMKTGVQHYLSQF